MSQNFCISSSETEPDGERAARRQLKLVAGLVAVLMAACLGVNLVVDPYGIFNLVEVKSLNGFRIGPATAERQYQFARAAILRPEAAVFGSSRAGMGLDPTHPALAQSARSGNLAISGPTIHEVRVLFDHAQQVAPLRRVVLALDFFMFNAQRADRPEFGRLAQRAGSIPVYLLPEFFLSFDALKASWDTIAAQSQSNLTPRRRDGMILAVRRAGPHWSSWREGIASYTQSMWTSGPGHCFAFAADGRDAFAELEAMLDLARKNAIDLRIVLSPVHVTLLEGVGAAGLWPQYEEWVRRVVELAGDSIPVWAFMMPSSITTEPVPPSLAEAPMTGFLDHSHYAPWVGNLMLDAAFGTGARRADFGERLTGSATGDYLARLRGAVDGYAARHPEQDSEVKGAVREALSGMERARLTDDPAKCRGRF